MPKTGLTRIVVNSALLLLAISAVFPVIWIGYNSLKTAPEFLLNNFSLPADPTLASYREILDDRAFFVALRNSLFYTIASTVLIVLFSFVVGYFLARFDFRGRKAIYGLFVAGLVIPIPSLLVPIFLQYRGIGMYDNQFTLLLPYVAFGLSIAVVIMESYIREISVEIDEAAHMDGAGLFTLMWVVIFPICRPAVSTVALLSFIAAWNEFAFAVTLVRNEEFRPLTLWLRTFAGQYSVNYPGMMAGMVLATIPVILIYLFFRDKISAGFAGGAVKM
ncbi:MAG: carbohydrate ABC transporter permease [Paracoccaceae bacterium]|nr:carbohydrate ABC transporter permease [Paracoccaceae bacterium]